MYVEIITSTKIPKLVKGFTNTGEDCFYHVGIEYANHREQGRYLISLLYRNNEEMAKYFHVSPDGKYFQMPYLNQLLNATLLFKQNDSGKWTANHNGVLITVGDFRSHNYFPFVSEEALKDIKPFESFCDFMLRQKPRTQQDVFIKLICDFVFPDISDWVETPYQDKTLIKMFRPENHKFVKHMLSLCQQNNTLHFIDEYIIARNDASIALNKISIL